MLRVRWSLMIALALAFFAFAGTSVAAPRWAPQQLSSDPFSGDGAQHRTQVEPDSFSFGPTVVAAFQSGRFFFGGGASGIGFATSSDAGRTWTSGFLPSLTVATGGSPERATDPSVAYDARQNVWLISSLRLAGPFTTISSETTDYVVSRSTDGGLSWSAPVVASPANPLPPPSPTFAHDKGWIACDNFPTSPFYGRCYLAFADFVNRHVSIIRSDDGGLTWSAPVVSDAGGTGVQPVVQPSGTVAIPYLASNPPEIRSIRSTNGGVTFEASVTIANVTWHIPTGMRALPVPSAEVDGGGKVYLAWHDCRFRPGCPANDIVYATSDDGVSWTGVKRVPIDRVTSGIDHFIPGLGVSVQTRGADTDIGLAYYYFPNAACTLATCALRVGFVSSRNAGKRWHHRRRLGGPMQLSRLADTSFGVNSHMVGDYISTSFVVGSKGSSIAVPVFSLASVPVGSTLRQSIWASALRVQEH